MLASLPLLMSPGAGGGADEEEADAWSPTRSFFGTEASAGLLLGPLGDGDEDGLAVVDAPARVKLEAPARVETERGPVALGCVL